MTAAERDRVDSAATPADETYARDGDDGDGDGGERDGDGDQRDEGGRDDADEIDTGHDDHPTDRRALRPFDTGRWVGVTGVALTLVGLGVALRQPGMVLVGAAAVGYGLYARLGEAGEAVLEIDREVSDPTPDPGDEVSVTVRARNVGDAPCLDLRIVDGVPPGLEVVDGPARVATALRPGASVTFSYAVRASRGDHEWGTTRAVVRNAAGSRERLTELETPTRLTCTPELAAGGDLPLRGLTTVSHGRVPTDVGGSGVEFHATREYRRGDPLKRVDWNRRARTGELATLELREERAATVVLLVDAREAAYVADRPDGDTAVEASVEAAGAVFTALLAGGDRVGIATMGPRDCWLPPGAGNDHAVRGRETLATDPALAPTPSEDRFYRTLWRRRFRRRLPGDAQVLFFTPLVDDVPVDTARRLDAYGHLVTVLSPDTTATRSSRLSSRLPSRSTSTPGRKLAAIERRERIRTLRGAGIRVVEWGDRSFPAAVAGANGRWSR
ncbi:conserved repeat domain-containing protein [Halorubrum aquaticum]|uniref:Conserved repeat domain-containing protein n=1 Tax=Halorubrum aquaticum TaxID=387340 RepID=A0A1I2ZU24_9EURY|nr:DUF58 domain-containing protein [Halorubrum aquaticum]SFH41009.1 conserved repeat domain-containing protein [Halorubrum aquaticum]